MPKPSRSSQLLERSVSAAVSAIEIYNKPDFKYREESFCILMVNAWELLFKAKIIKDNNNNPSNIYIKEPVKKKDGTCGKRLIYRENRCKNYVTIDLFRSIEKIVHAGTIIDSACRANIELLVEIRDNATHFFNKDILLNKKILEIGTATLRSYVTLVNEWFEYDLNKYNFYLMPLSFFHPYELDSFSITKRDLQISRLLDYILQRECEFTSNIAEAHNISLRVETKFVKSQSTEALNVRYTKDPNAPVVRVEEENIFITKYPMSYSTLRQKLKERYTDFKQDKRFHNLKGELESNITYCRTRFLDPANPKGATKKFYNTEIFKEFDKYYTKNI